MKKHRRSVERRKLRRYKYRCKKKASKFTNTKSKEPMDTREFKRYKAYLPIGPLEIEENSSMCDEAVVQNLTDTQEENRITCDEAVTQNLTDTREENSSTCDEAVTQNLTDTREENRITCDEAVTQNFTDTRHKSHFQDIFTVCTCTKKSINLDPILIPMEEESPIKAVSSEGDDIVHTIRCSEHVQRARVERNNALHLARLYHDRVNNLIKQKREIQHSLKVQVDKTRDFGEIRLLKVVQEQER